MSVHGPLGATASNGAFELGRSARATPGSWRAGLALGGLAVGTLVITVTAANTDALLPQSVRPVPAWLAGPFAHAAVGLAPAELITVFVLMAASYVAAIRLADQLSPRAVLGTIVALHALVLLAPPLLSTDVFSYQAYARMWAGYGINPYRHGPLAIALDPLYPFIGAKWVGTPSVYGPVFTMLSYAFGTVSIALSALAFKAIAAAASLGTVGLLWKGARMRGLDPVRSVALFGLNPLVVVYAVGGGHNDLLMLLAVTAGLAAMLAHQHRSGGAMIALASGLKLTGILFLPFLLAGHRGPAAVHRRRDLALGAGIAAAAIAAAGALAFGTGPLELPRSLISTQAAGDWHSIPGFISTRLSLETLGHVTGIVLILAFAVVCWMLLVRVWRGELDPIDACAWAVIAMLVCASSLMPWYAAWLLPFVALSRDRRLWRWALVVSVVVLAVQLPDYVPHGSSLPGL